MKESKSSKALDALVNFTRVKSGQRVRLGGDFDPGYHPEGIDKEQGADLLQTTVREMAELQDKLYAQDRYALLVIFQAMDAAGKDGAIKQVMSGLNPQGCQVFSFKAPSSEELDHDYLWRCFKALPERGRMGIFNRSYYEEVLVARVHPEILARQKLPEALKDKGIWKRRFEEINAFEKYLAGNGVVVVKFFLNVSKDEQKKRFLDRIERREKNWKFSAADVKERGFWDDYMKAYEDCLSQTNTEWAPWHVVPADAKWVTRLAASEVIVRTLRSLKLEYPKVSAEERKALDAARVQLESEA